MGCVPVSLPTRSHPHLPAVSWASAAWPGLVRDWTREPQRETGGTEEKGTYSHGTLPTGASWASHVPYQNSLTACLHMASLTQPNLLDSCVPVPWALRAVTGALTSFLSACFWRWVLYTPTALLKLYYWVCPVFSAGALV